MKRSQIKNGLSIEENIEVTEERSNGVSIVAYFVQVLILIVLALSILYSFLSGMQIEINAVGLFVRVVLSVCFFFALFLCRRYMKYTLPATGLLFLIVAIIWRNDIQAGFARVANTLLELYGNYFGKRVNLLDYDISYGMDDNNTFIYFFSFLLSALLCYVVIYGKNFITYMVVTIPIVFSPLVIGFVPSLLPYIGYVAGTLGIHAILITERYRKAGIKDNHTQNKQVFYRLSSSKVVAQGVIIGCVAILMSLAYICYSPERYEQEFEAQEIRQNVKDKFDQLMSGQLLKDTIFGEIFHSKTGKSGLNKGSLNKVEGIEYSHETALKVTTAGQSMADTFYLRGYVGQQYSSSEWLDLSNEDEKRLRQLEKNLELSKNAESINSSMMNMLSQSPYASNEYNKTVVKVENVAANKSVSYIPYNIQSNIVNSNGNLTSSKNSFVFYQFTNNTSEGSPLSEKFRNYEFANMLKLNLVDSSIYENYFGLEMNKDWQKQVKSDDEDALNDLMYPLGTNQVGNYQENFTVPLDSIYSGETSLDMDLNLYLNRKMYTSDLGDYIANMNQYAKEENEYYKFVRDVYTKLPATGLEKVKQVVAGREVEIEPTDLNGENYSSIEQIGAISSVEQSYNRRYNTEEVKTENGAIEDDYSIQAKYYDAIEFVRNYLALNTSYDLKPGKAPSDEDYVEYFLFTNKKGFCVHYATAATVMLRAMGVPARYAEGYVVTKEDFAKGKVVGDQSVEGYTEISGDTSNTLESVEINVEDANAHAWVEVYLPGMGWQPIEMTAPYVYYSEIEVPDVNTNPKATLKPTPIPTIKPTPTPTSTPKVTKTPTPSKTPAPSKTPIVTNKSNKKDDGLASWFSKLDETTKKIIFTVLAIVTMFIAALLVIYLRVFIIKKIQAMSREKLSNNDRVLYDNKQFNALLKHFHLRYKSNQPYTEFVEKVTKKFTFLDEQQANTYYAIVLKAKFNNAELTNEEVLTCEQFYETCVNGLCEKESRWKRWVYKRIWNL